MHANKNCLFWLCNHRNFYILFHFKVFPFVKNFLYFCITYLIFNFMIFCFSLFSFDFDILLPFYLFILEIISFSHKFFWDLPECRIFDYNHPLDAFVVFHNVSSFLKGGLLLPYYENDLFQPQENFGQVRYIY